MNALLLPGNSPRHAEWVEHLKTAITPEFDTVKTQHYHHWKTGEEWADVEYELTMARENTVALEPYVIIAKSIGTVIATRGVAEDVLDPTKIILLGIPINGGAKIELIKEWLTEIAIPIVIIQNMDDPLGSFADVKAAFDGIGEHVSFVELPGETHDYVDFEAITRFIHA